MAKPSLGLFCVVVLLVLAVSCTPAGFKKISQAELRDRIEGGWAGQMIGVSFGAPTEFRARGIILEGELKPWTPDRVSNSLQQDDLYVDMTFAKVLDDKGLDATTDDFGAMFRDSKYRLWHANLAARRALKRGVKAGESGMPKYNSHANDIDFQIEADFIGLMAPGLYRSAGQIADRAGRVMNYGDGLYGGVFVSCMYSAAFFEKDPRKIVEIGLACIPSESPYAKLITDLLAWSKDNPADWKKTWQLMQDKWDKREPCPSGALKPFNIDAKLNGAYIALGLLYGELDFGKTIEISTRAGQDSDCNPSSAAGILGVMLGYQKIPENWKGGIPKLADEKFSYTDFSFRTIVASTEKRALALIQKTGGRVEGDTILVKLEPPQPGALELWDDYGSPVERVAVSDPRWKFRGAWTSPDPKVPSKLTSRKGAEATVDFEGTGAIVTGAYLEAGGKADVYLDGKLDRTVDFYSDGEGRKDGDSVWHAFGLENKKHSVRFVVRGEPHGESKGAEVEVQEIVVFR